MPITFTNRITALMTEAANEAQTEEMLFELLVTNLAAIEEIELGEENETELNNHENTIVPESDTIRVFNSRTEFEVVGNSMEPVGRAPRSCGDDYCTVCPTVEPERRHNNIQIDPQPDDRRTAWAKRLP